MGNEIMSKRRKPLEIVKRKAGSGFCGSSEPKYILLPEINIWNDEVDGCMLCDDPLCLEFANVEVLDDNKRPTGQYMFHISECEMEDL